MLYAVGDIHGQYDQLTRALALIERDGGQGAQIVFLGDYTDRGPDSRSVLNTLIEGRDAGRNWHFIKGNHDRMCRLFLETKPQQDPHLRGRLNWLDDRLGGGQTLASYGVDITGSEADIHRQARALVPSEHIEFLHASVLSFETEHLYFAHAGIRPGVPLERQQENDLLWIRDPFLNDTTPHPKLIVHGHTPVDFPENRSNRINLDGGAGYGRDLWPARFDETGCTVLTERSMIPLTPF